MVFAEVASLATRSRLDGYCINTATWLRAKDNSCWCYCWLVRYSVVIFPRARSLFASRLFRNITIAL